MRILLALHQFFPDFRGGTETLVLRTAQELRRRGHDIAVLTGSPHNPHRRAYERYSYEGIEIHRADEGPRPALTPTALKHLFPAAQISASIETALDEFKPDAVHSFHFMRLTAALLESCHARRLPIIATLTDYWVICPMSQLMLRNGEICRGADSVAANCLNHLASLRFPAAEYVPKCSWPILGAALLGNSYAALRSRTADMRRAFGSQVRVLVPTECMKSVLEQQAFNAAKLTVCPYGIDLRGLAPRDAIARRPMPGRPIRVGFIGTLNEGKGAMVFLDAIRFLGSGSSIRGLLYADASQGGAYGRRVVSTAAGMSVVEMCGTFDPNQIFEVFRTFDVLVVPSTWRENSPLVIQYAQAARVPVVASRVDGISHLIEDGVNGLLFERGKPDRLADCLRSLTPERVACMSEASITPRSIEDYCDELEGYYAAMT